MNAANYLTVPGELGANLIDQGQALLTKYGPKLQSLLAKVAPAQEAPAETVPDVPDEQPGAIVEPAPSPSGLDAVPGWAKIGLVLGAIYLFSNRR